MIVEPYIRSALVRFALRSPVLAPSTKRIGFRFTGAFNPGLGTVRAITAPSCEYVDL